MLSLLENITGQSFIDYVSAHDGIADTFSLIKNKWSTAEKSHEHSAVLNALAPYHIRTVYTNRWFGHCVPDGYKIEVYLFHFTPESKKVLLSNYDSIFYNDSVWRKPEDLCFFKNQKLISGSVTHEKICFSYSETMRLPGIWETLPTNTSEQICIPE